MQIPDGAEGWLLPAPPFPGPAQVGPWRLCSRPGQWEQGVGSSGFRQRLPEREGAPPPPLSTATRQDLQLSTGPLVIRQTFFQGIIFPGGG